MFNKFKENHPAAYWHISTLATFVGLSTIIGLLVKVLLGNYTFAEFFMDTENIKQILMIAIFGYAVTWLLNSIKDTLVENGVDFSMFSNANSNTEEGDYSSKTVVPRVEVEFKYWYGDMINGFARIERYYVVPSSDQILQYDCNFIDSTGKIISDVFFENCSDFIKEGVALVKKEGVYNIINKEGKIVSDEWFASMEPFYKGIAKVQREDHTINYIKTDGTLLFLHWKHEDIRKPEQ